MGTGTDKSLFSGINIAVEEASACAGQLRSDILTPIAKTFTKNAYDILGLLSLPLVLMIYGSREALWLVFFTKALHTTGNIDKFEDSESARREVMAEADRLFNAEMEKMRPHVIEDAKRSLEKLLLMDVVRSSVRSLLLAATSAGWTAFESLATDTWVAGLNARPIPLAQRALDSVPAAEPSEGISSKHISVGLMVRYGFDLRNKLGEVLRPKFDFTSVSGIHKAYVSSFGRSQDIDNALGNSDLKLLEATRHLIVHRGAIVDEQFKKRTQCPTAVGEALPLDGETVSRLVNAAIKAGCSLLLIVDDWLVHSAA